MARDQSKPTDPARSSARGLPQCRGQAVAQVPEHKQQPQRNSGWAGEGSHPVPHRIPRCRVGTQGRGQVGALPCPLWLMSFPSTAFLIML